MTSDRARPKPQGLGPANSSAAKAPRAPAEGTNSVGSPRELQQRIGNHATQGLVQMVSPSVGALVPPGGRSVDHADGLPVEKAIGMDLSHVRKYRDGVANAQGKELGARGYRVDSHAVLGAASISPGSSAERHLLQHELIHVAQQSPIAATPTSQHVEGRTGTAGEELLRAGSSGERSERGGLGGSTTPSPGRPASTLARADGTTSVSWIDFNEFGEAREQRMEFPSGPVSDDRVVDRPSPFEGNTLLVRLGPFQAVKVRSVNYAVSSELARAVVWGNALFGVHGYAILQGPLHLPADQQRYFTVGIDTRLDLSQRSPEPGQEFFGVAGRLEWFLDQHDRAERRSHLLRVIVTHTRTPFFPPSIRHAESFSRQLEATAEGRGTIPLEVARRELFRQIEDLLRDGQTQRASERLSQLGVDAFTVLDFEEKARYVRVLVEAWTRRPQENASVRILEACDGRSELLALVEVLRRGGIFDQLFADLDSEMWQLLRTVGERFGDPGGLTRTELIDIGLELGLDLGRSAVGLNAFDELYEAARGLVRLVVGTLEGLWMLVTEPDKVALGIAHLAELVMMIQLARFGYPPAVAFLDDLTASIGRAIVAGMKGARLLGVSAHVLRRIKWALVLEVASWFVGVGQVRAALGSVSAARRAVSLGRLSGAIGGLGRVADVAGAARKVENVTSLMARASRVADTDMLRAVSHLPDEDLGRLARALEHIDLSDVRRLSDLTGEAAASTRHAMERANALRVLETRAGRLTDDLAAGFHRLARDSGFGNAQLRAIMDALAPPNAEIFMHVVRDMPAGAFRGVVGGRGRSHGFFTNLAVREQATGFIFNQGYDAFAVVHRGSSHNWSTLDRTLDAIRDVSRNLDVVQRRRLIDRLRAGDQTTWLEVTAARRRVTAAGGRTAGSPEVLSSGRHVWRRNDGVTVREYEIDTYGLLSDNRRSNNYFQAHHPIQDMWAETRLAQHYRTRRAPAILLRDSRRGTPHRIITDRQDARRAGVAERTYAEERRLLRGDLQAAGVPDAERAAVLRRCDEYFSELYRAMQGEGPQALRRVFGDWTP
jgi:hypothetical protein